MTGSTEYTLAEFRETYGLKPDKAERIFKLSGPSKTNLDVFMRVYRKPKAAEDIFVASER